MNAHVRPRATVLVSILGLAVAATAAGGGLGALPEGGRSKNPPQERGCFVPSSAKGGKARAAAAVGAAVGAAIGGPALARALPDPGPDASLLTRFAANTLWATAWSEYLGVMGKLASSNPAPLFVQFAPGQFATWSGAGLSRFSPLGGLGAPGPATLGSLVSPGFQPSVTKAMQRLDGMPSLFVLER